MKQAVGGGAIVLMLATMGGVAFDKWMAHRERLMQIQQSRITWDQIDECEQHGGRWWKGDCLLEENAP